MAYLIDPYVFIQKSPRIQDTYKAYNKAYPSDPRALCRFFEPLQDIIKHLVFNPIFLSCVNRAIVASLPDNEAGCWKKRAHST
jgi:hypothetical protein